LFVFKVVRFFFQNAAIKINAEQLKQRSISCTNWPAVWSVITIDQSQDTYWPAGRILGFA